MTDINFEKMQYMYLPSPDGGVSVYAFTKRQDRKMFIAKNQAARLIGFEVVHELGKDQTWKPLKLPGATGLCMWMHVPKIAL